MAPKRKNKKIASNPARGFATTSTASKTKPPSEEPSESAALGNEPTTHKAAQNPCSGDVAAEKELHELSPEELERQLEESDLRVFVEKYIDKIKKDVSRQVARLRTEKRLLRPQAESLSTRSWLPPEVMLLATNALEAEQSSDSYGNASLNHKNAEGLSGDDLCTRIWTLEQVLIQLGFPCNICHEALRHLLAVAQSSSWRDLLTRKDNIWGLDCCLDWLAMHCEAPAVPSYNRDPVGKDAAHRNDAIDDFSEKDSRTDYEDASTQIVSRMSPSLGNQVKSCDEVQEPEDFTTSADHDTESDTDPETMTKTYVALQTQLYSLQPDLQVEERQAPANAPAVSRNAPQKRFQPQIARLLQRLERLKADILFDRQEAEQLWIETRNKLAQAAAERKRLHLQSESRPVHDRADGQSVTGKSTSQPKEASEGSGEEEDGGVEAFGEFFSGLPGLTASDSNDRITSDASGKGPDSRGVTIKDFGKWGGVSPRRTFEEACKSRSDMLGSGSLNNTDSCKGIRL
ncbi:MAG: hypothetical protein Q9178_004784 [Gyalolechia marmorata]